MFIYFKVFTFSTNDHCNPCQFLCSCYLSWSVFAKKGHVYTLIVCDSDEDKYTFSSIILSDFWLVYCFYFFFKKVFEFFLKYKYVLEKTLNLNIHATFTNSKIWNIYVHLFDSKNILSYSSKCLLLAEIDPRLFSIYINQIITF